MNESEHLLTCLMEECAEVQKNASKALRFGLHDVKPSTTSTNEVLICEELSDLLSVIELLLQKRILYSPVIPNIRKIQKIKKYMTYARKTGALT